MNTLKVLSAAAALALAVPMVLPTSGFAQERGVSRGGGGGIHAGGGARMGGPRMGGTGATFGGAGRVAATSPSFRGGAVAAAPAARGAYAGRYAGAYGNRGFGRGVGVGAAVGTGVALGALGSSYAYYGGGPGYYDPGYYGDDYAYDSGYDYGGDVGYDAGVAVAPGGDASSYCAQRFRSYDPASGTYLGYDGQRHPCP